MLLDCNLPFFPDPVSTELYAAIEPVCATQSPTLKSVIVLFSAKPLRSHLCCCFVFSDKQEDDLETTSSSRCPPTPTPFTQTCPSHKCGLGTDVRSTPMHPVLSGWPALPWMGKGPVPGLATLWPPSVSNTSKSQEPHPIPNHAFMATPNHGNKALWDGFLHFWGLILRHQYPTFQYFFGVARAGLFPAVAECHRLPRFVGCRSFT